MAMSSVESRGKKEFSIWSYVLGVGTYAQVYNKTVRIHCLISEFTVLFTVLLDRVCSNDVHGVT